MSKNKITEKLMDILGLLSYECGSDSQSYNELKKLVSSLKSMEDEKQEDEKQEGKMVPEVEEETSVTEPTIEDKKPNISPKDKRGKRN